MAIAAALVLRPRILVLDEPTSQLDPEAADDLMNALTRLNRERGLTIVLAEHRVERVLPWVDQVILVQAGQVMAGAPRDVLAHTELVPPVVALGKALAWPALALSVEEARQATAGGHIRKSEPRASADSDDNVTRRETPPALILSAVRAGYQRQDVLHEVSLTVRPREMVALMGHNGAGKSTLLKCVVGLVTPTGGDIRVNGVSVVGRGTGYLP